MVYQLLGSLFNEHTRVGVFIDDAYFLKGVEELGNFNFDRLDFHNRLARLPGGHLVGTINRIYLHTAIIAQEDGQVRFNEQEERLKERSSLPLLEINRGRVTGRGSSY